ncbi:LPS-assembly protein LptD [Jannaschia pagri]|uniref:LPS-assembly protein LptD n=1 Tax=Jannaschia pagri TaxID=2829797 RepID=A0ABQ4NGC3_9RHOB|nr:MULTISPECIES: LPS assembly protein LptD [unclassified Jannaschia]GIT90427.1 LPS-assembly protein LptD [Jannaschia sp. AI_61]GIT93468.1 LPS-assembly protein LptD [Jannaschia sp. AI_62]
MRWLVLCLALMAAPAHAQTAPATLVADRIDFDPTRLVASGAVEIFAEGRILRAPRITYLRQEDRLIVDGPLTLIDGDEAVLVADFASLSPDLQGSVLQGARLVLDDRLQVAATEVTQGEEGRYTQLFQAVASSCPVCDEGDVPLWQIRAKRIIHDRQEKQIYFDSARFDVAGVPVAWLPRLRLPDPTLERTSGWLAPRFSSDDLLGTGVTTPYFFTLGPSRDLTLSPMWTNFDTRSLGVRYRQAFNTGRITVEGALSDDRLTSEPWRGYVFAEGQFRLPRDYRLDFDIEAVSDDTYLLNYDISEKDRLDSRIAVSRVERDSRLVAEAILFQSLRTGDDDRFLPTRVLTVERQGRTEPDLLGGQALWTLQAHARERTATTVPAGQSANAARDVLRASAAVDWRRSWVTGGGLVFTGLGGLHLDAYNIRQDDTFADTTFARAVPYAGLEARLPLARTDQSGVRHVIEPVMQVILAPENRATTPDEDSLTPEFDEGNLFSASRFAGRDTRELGNRVNLGLGYTRYRPDGWTVGALVGRVIRSRDLGQFRPETGLDGKSSDWLLSFGIADDNGFEAMTRSIFDDQLSVNRSETILRWSSDDHALETRYTFLQADTTAGRPIDTSEWSLDAARNLGGDWTGRANWRYDFVTNDASRAGLGLTYRSDCVTVDFDVERRFTSSTTLQPSTRFGLSVELAGFGADDRAKRARKCGL